MYMCMYMYMHMYIERISRSRAHARFHWSFLGPNYCRKQDGIIANFQREACFLEALFGTFWYILGPEGCLKALRGTPLALEDPGTSFFIEKGAEMEPVGEPWGSLLEYFCIQNPTLFRGRVPGGIWETFLRKSAPPRPVQTR